MTTIADSNAFRDPGRVLPQHQAALTLLQDRLSAPGISRVSWLDLACGRGQIIVSLDENLSAEARAKIEFWAYDLDNNFARETKRTAKRLGFASLKTSIGTLSDFDRILPAHELFDFITLTNTVHEIEPIGLARLLLSCIKRLTDAGSLFMYDMERIRPPELGALPWNRDDIRRIVHCMLDAIGASTYRPEVGLWNHRTCNGWNVQLQRQHLNVSRADVAAKLESAVELTRTEVLQLLHRRQVECCASLETLTMYGAETAEEQDDKERLLFEFWALCRALEHNS